MQESILTKWNRWLLPVVLILFILQVIMLPWAMGFTWADRSDSPAHILTYTKNKLSWDSATGIRADGTAELSLFSPEYGSTVISAGGDDVVAPGTSNDIYVRLKNNVSGSIKYTAVLYELKSDERIPVKAGMKADGSTVTADYTLPDGVSASDVITAVTGRVAGKSLQDLDIDWLWEFYENDAQDVVDTALGNMEELPEVTVGLYIVVEDGNSYVTPDSPQTGDNSHIGLYIGLMVVSFILLILLLLDRRREEKRETN